MTAEDMLFGIALARGVKVTDISGPSRISRIASARHEAMWLIREATDLSFPDIGRMLGGRDHSTVIAAHKKIQARVDRDPAYGEQLKQAATATRGGLEVLRLQRRAQATAAQVTTLQRRLAEVQKRLEDERAA